MTLFELWHSESEPSYALRYFPDIASYPVRPLDERVVFSVHADSYEAALRKQNEFLGWDPEPPPPVLFDYPPDRRTFLVVHDYGQGGIWAFVDAVSSAQIESRFSALQVISERQPWFTPEEQRHIAERHHYDADQPCEWLRKFGNTSGPAV